MRRIVAVVVVVCGVTVVRGTSTESQTAPVLRIATGLPSMTFNRLGRELADAFGQQMPDVRFAVVETPGSVRNIELLERGEAELALSLADVAYLGYNGELPALQQRSGQLRGVAVLHHSRVHVLARAGASITAMSDLRGRTIAIGPPGSGTAETSQLLLTAFDLPLHSVTLRSLPFADVTAALTRGEVEASIIVAGDPVDAVSRATAAGARLLDITGPKALALRTRYRFLRVDVIPPQTYRGQEQTVQTLGVDVLLLCRAGVEAALVRRLTAALFSALPALASRLNYLRAMDLRRAPATPVPLHAGAALYYREQELVR
jgi:TRAP transporter TAXI family solute receptor